MAAVSTPVVVKAALPCTPDERTLIWRGLVLLGASVQRAARAETNIAVAEIRKRELRQVQDLISRVLSVEEV